ncbi:hypothetical protein DSL92_05265 [Billgrantia gudaonensis]|uniref:Uncharacterized protein n=1 Tax=Billgrantia gudaonensis TaxID=376427 RepID=A0A432JJ00_9GAMM|nr:hypothetical protein DSL92_05265 [Halomonas gudaonensis]
MILPRQVLAKPGGWLAVRLAGSRRLSRAGFCPTSSQSWPMVAVRRLPWQSAAGATGGRDRPRTAVESRVRSYVSPLVITVPWGARLPLNAGTLAASSQPRPAHAAGEPR